MRAILAVLLTLFAGAAVAQTPQQRMGAQLQREEARDRLVDGARDARRDPQDGSRRIVPLDDDRATLRPDAGQTEEGGLLPDGVRALGVDSNVTR